MGASATMPLYRTENEVVANGQANGGRGIHNQFNDFGRYGVYVEPDASRPADCDVNENVNQVSAGNSEVSGKSGRGLASGTTSIFLFCFFPF
jgi:hypothetical protein